MWQGLGYLLDAWRTVLHVSALTGISVTLLIGLGALAFLLPEWRAIAIRVGAAVGLAYVVSIYTFHLGAKDVRAQWDAANTRAEQERWQRDAKVKADAEREMAPLVAQMRTALESRNKQVTDYEQKLLAAKSGAAACQLGPDALRLRGKRAR